MPRSELTSGEKIAADTLCEIRHHDVWTKEPEFDGCPVCQAEVVRLVDGAELTPADIPRIVEDTKAQVRANTGRIFGAGGAAPLPEVTQGDVALIEADAKRNLRSTSDRCHQTGKQYARILRAIEWLRREGGR